MDGGLILVKKKILECKIHGDTLHRCKRKYWMTGNISFDYTEKCYKCMQEGRLKKVEIKKVKIKHIKAGR